jgi:DNA-directed RNA polymerase subunit RPC12/RpoP
MNDNQIDSKEFLEKFNLKSRVDCAHCGGTEFRLGPTGMPNTTIDEAVMMECKNCGHTRLELV